jgi:hypothetical protein
MLMDEARNPSRRSMLRAVALAGAGLAAGAVTARRAQAQQKASKQAMQYQDKPSGDKKCSECLQFVAPASCKVVEGTISPNGYCIAWVKKP